MTQVDQSKAGRRTVVVIGASLGVALSDQNGARCLG